MKKALLPLAIAAALPVSALAAGPVDGKIYGKAFVTFDSYEFTDDATPANDYDELQMNSAASRLGVSGKSELSEGLYAIYKAEYEIDVDNGDDVFKQRNIYVGLNGGFGTVIAGKHDTPTKLAQNKIDLFNDLVGDIKNTFEGENREGNIVMYTTPTMSGLSATLAVMASEGNDVDADGEADDGLEGKSLSVSYEMDDLYLALAMDQNVDLQDLMRAIAQYKIGGLQVGFMYQQSENADDSELKDESGYFVSAAYKIDAVTLKAQYGTLESDTDNDYEEETFSIGADYKLAKSTKVLAYYTVNTDTSAAGDDKEESVFGVGMEHKF